MQYTNRFDHLLSSSSRQAVINLLRFYMLFRPVSSSEADAKIAPARQLVHKTMDDSLQYRCAGAIQAAIEHQMDILHQDDDEGSDAASDVTEDEDRQANGDGKTKANKSE